MHNQNGAVHLCHTSCSLLDGGLLSTYLSKVKSWLDANTEDGELRVARNQAFRAGLWS